MSLSRRRFCALLAGGAAASIPLGLAGKPASGSPIKAVAFDAFVIFDPRPLVGLAEQLFPGKGQALSEQWRNRQFEYGWLRVTARRYADFWQVTEEALEFAAEEAKLALTREKRARLLNAFLALDAWPEVTPALRSLAKSGFRLALLSNLSPMMLAANVTHAGLTGIFEQTLSTDQAKTYKPDPAAYQLGPDALRLPREEILFVAFAGWDAAGAKSFGHPTFWVNRLGLPTERLGIEPDKTGKALDDLIVYLAKK